MGLLDKDEEALERSRLEEIDSGDELKVMLKRLSWDYAGGRQVHDWVADVRTVALFRTPGQTDAIVEKLATWGMGDYESAPIASPEVADEYGRGYLDYLKQRNELEEMTDQEAHGELTSDERASFRRRIQILDSEFSDPVTIDAPGPPGLAVRVAEAVELARERRVRRDGHRRRVRHRRQVGQQVFQRVRQPQANHVTRALVARHPCHDRRARRRGHDVRALLGHRVERRHGDAVRTLAVGDDNDRRRAHRGFIGHLEVDLPV